MTESTIPYYHWSSRNDSLSAPYNACSPNLLQIQAFYGRTRGGHSLGCHVQRSVSGSSTLSTHAWGAACDWLFPNRTVTLEAMQWTIGHSAEMGVNTIHDYVTQRMWKPITGWSAASIGSVGGQWIHVETTPAAFLNATKIEDRLPGTIDEIPGDEPMSPEDKAYMEGPYANILAEKVWVRMYGAEYPPLTNRPMKDWIIDDVSKATRTEEAVAELTKLVKSLALVAGDPEAVKAAVREIVHGELAESVWQYRTPS